MSLGLSMWVVYGRPRDYPEGFVARRWLITPGEALPTDDVRRAPSLDEVRALLPEGLYRMDRVEDDDPAIVETWF